MCLAQRPQLSDTGEARTRGLLSRVKHSTTEPLHSQLFSEIRPLIDGTLSKIKSLECTDGPCLTEMKPNFKKVEGDMFYADEKVS